MFFIVVQDFTCQQIMKPIIAGRNGKSNITLLCSLCDEYISLDKSIPNGGIDIFATHVLICWEEKQPKSISKKDIISEFTVYTISLIQSSMLTACYKLLNRLNIISLLASN